MTFRQFHGKWRWGCYDAPGNMNRSSGFIKLAGLLILVVAVGVLIGLMATRRAGEVAPAPVPPAEGPEPIARTSPVPLTSRTVASAKPQAQPANAAIQAATPLPATVSTNPLPDWEDRLDDILGSDDEDKLKTTKLLELFPRMPEEGQEETARHLANLVEDADYAALGKILTNTTFPESVLDVLLQDALNRPNELKLPLLLDVAKGSGHPKAEEAKDLLELFLEEDYGTDWARWESEMQKWLKDNPE
jgi:hypothetical protein